MDHWAFTGRFATLTPQITLAEFEGRATHKRAQQKSRRFWHRDLKLTAISPALNQRCPVRPTAFHGVRDLRHP